MDMINVGIGDTNSRKNQKLLSEINSNNTISIKLTKHLNELNAFTKEFLSQQAPILMNYSNTANEEIDQLQNVFQEVYSLYQVDKSKVKKLPSLAQLKSLRTNLGDFQTNKVDPLSISLTNFINYYTLIGINQELSTTLIYRTIVNYNQINYWTNLQESNLLKLVYGIQILPIEIWNLSQGILLQSKEKLKFSNYDVHGSFTEEDNIVYHNIELLKRFLAIAKSSFVDFVKDSVRLTNPINFLQKKESMREMIGRIISSPVQMINKRITAKIDLINKQLEINYEQLGLLMKNLPVDILQNDKFTKEIEFESNLRILEKISDLELLISSNSINQRINTLTDRINEMSQYHEHLLATQKPGVLIRYWPMLLILIKYGPLQSINLFQNRKLICQWIQHNLIDTIIGFWTNWVITPLTNMFGILRNDEMNELSITSKESLKSDLDSLERMVIDYAVDYNKTDESDELKLQIHNAVNQGDLTILMSNYEQDLKNPIKSLVKGSLVRALLIQIQKTKVDGGLAINGIDKLLKSQQLVFGVVSISPSIFIIYQLYNQLISKRNERGLIINGENVKFICLKSLNNIEKLIIKKDDNLIDDGKIFIEIINLIIQSKKVIPKQLKSEWISDLNALNEDATSTDDKLKNINRIWNLYGAYFR